MNALFAYLVEKFFYSDYISPDLYQNNAYSFSAGITLLVTVIMSFAYYFCMDNARYSGFKTWFIVAIIGASINTIANFLYVDSALKELSEQGYMQEYFQYALVYGGFTFGFYIVFSLFTKRFTKSLSRSPF